MGLSGKSKVRSGLYLGVCECVCVHLSIPGVVDSHVQPCLHMTSSLITRSDLPPTHTYCRIETALWSTHFTFTYSLLPSLSFSLSLSASRVLECGFQQKHGYINSQISAEKIKPFYFDSSTILFGEKLL